MSNVSITGRQNQGAKTLEKISQKGGGGKALAGHGVLG